MLLVHRTFAVERSLLSDAIDIHKATQAGSARKARLDRRVKIAAAIASAIPLIAIRGSAALLVAVLEIAIRARKLKNSPAESV